MSNLSKKCILSYITLRYEFSVILDRPEDRTVFLGDGEGAYFSCTTRDSSSTHWRVNDTDYDDLPSQIQHGFVINMILSLPRVIIEIVIPARAEYNGTRVQCVAESDDGQSLVSDNATLTIIQGNNVGEILRCSLYFCANVYIQVDQHLLPVWNSVVMSHPSSSHGLVVVLISGTLSSSTM